MRRVRQIKSYISTDDAKCKNYIFRVREMKLCEWVLNLNIAMDLKQKIKYILRDQEGSSFVKSAHTNNLTLLCL
jgi:hypothetical protein